MNSAAFFLRHFLACLSITLECLKMAKNTKGKEMYDQASEQCIFGKIWNQEKFRNLLDRLPIIFSWQYETFFRY